MPYSHNTITRKRPSWNVVDSKLRPLGDTFERVDFNPEAFDRLVQQKGVQAKIYRTTYCPKVKSVDGAEHEIDCQLCNGSGWIDLDPICAPVVIQAQELEKMPNVEGFVDGNTVLATFPIGVELQYFTLVELEDFTDIYMQRVNRAPGTTTDILKYRACRVNVVVDYDGKRYFQGLDFAIDVNGNIKWLTPGDQQLVDFSAVPTSGTFTLTFGGNTTAAIQWNAAASAVQTALRAVAGLENVTVSGNFTDGFTVTFIGVDSPVASLTSASSLLDGVTAVTISVEDASVTASKPNDDVAYSVHYEAAVQFRAASAVKVNRFTQWATGDKAEHIKLPEHWYLKKEFLVRRRDIDGNDTEQGPYGEWTASNADNKQAT